MKPCCLKKNSELCIYKRMGKWFAWKWFSKKGIFEQPYSSIYHQSAPFVHQLVNNEFQGIKSLMIQSVKVGKNENLPILWQILIVWKICVNLYLINKWVKITRWNQTWVVPIYILLKPIILSFWVWFYKSHLILIVEE